MDISVLQSCDLRFVVIPALAVMAFIGLVAIFSPQAFATLSQASSQWVDTQRIWEILDRRIDIVDRMAIRHSRLFGLIVLAASLWMAWLYWTQVLGLAPPVKF